MIYQERYQSGEKPDEVNVSSCIYGSFNADGFPRHCHSYFELEYSIEGDRIICFNQEMIRVPERGLYFVSPLTVHSTINHAVRTKNIVLQFGREFLKRNSRSLPQNTTIKPTGKLLENHFIIPEKGSELAFYIDKLTELSPIHEISSSPKIDRSLYEINKNNDDLIQNFLIDYNPTYEWKLNAYTLGLIATMVDHNYLEIVESFGKNSDMEKIYVVLNEMIMYPEKKLTLGEAAKMACMSYSGFSRRFKYLVGHNYVDYCNLLRIRQAEDLLVSTAMTITEIAEQLNFGRVNYFNRIFKKYNGNNPLNYRKEQKKISL